MSKSLKRVTAALEACGIQTEIRHIEASTKTAQDAADAIAVDVDQIAKSVIFRGETSDKPYLFITAGRNRVDTTLATALAGEPLGKADAAFIRATTGFAIGGCAPLGAIAPLDAWLDTRLTEFQAIWAAAGTPHHMFEIAPETLSAAASAPVAAFTQKP